MCLLCGTNRILKYKKRLIFISEVLKKSPNTYDSNFLRQGSPREVTVCELVESEFFSAAQAVVMCIELILSPGSRLTFIGIHEFRSQNSTITMYTYL